MRDLRNKKCLITGAASGIGRATAMAAARDGAELFLTDINAPELERVAAGTRRRAFFAAMRECSGGFRL